MDFLLYVAKWLLYLVGAALVFYVGLIPFAYLWSLAERLEKPDFDRAKVMTLFCVLLSLGILLGIIITRMAENRWPTE